MSNFHIMLRMILSSVASQDLRPCGGLAAVQSRHGLYAFIVDFVEMMIRSIVSLSRCIIYFNAAKL